MLNCIIPVLLDNRVVGQVVGNTFTKKVRASIHFLRIPPAIAFDICTLDYAENFGALYVQVEELESSRIYSASIRLIREKGFIVDRGFGKQIALHLSQWQIVGEPVQLGFWA